MLVVLSFWITALWFHVYYVKLILVAGVLAVIGVFAVIRAIFSRPSTDHVVDGRVL